MSATRIILIEDDDLTRTTIESALNKKGLDVLFSTASISEALIFARKNSPQAAVIDYNLGAGPNGIDAANGLRKIDRNIGIVLMTAFLNPTQLPTLLTKLPSGSKYLIKHSVSAISVLVREIEAAISAKK